jgi:hypothetical protein
MPIEPLPRFLSQVNQVSPVRLYLLVVQLKQRHSPYSITTGVRCLEEEEDNTMTSDAFMSTRAHPSSVFYVPTK